ncbi:hypothetical protein BCR32DRAFT_277126 [Anaeromyces robustus]|uniref:Uncharacterized protein n=1 Tax=Anaeromyces robustus TaxID=1754192 RepID=A0A1Y1XF88_9FUNG|nr:hypothetical protein BCR32DRAFT_277126 [Anaeromyces robustus]|eukprot:ORX84429.1 hypothetical protein BCR32DRAFT_277126 [Anaeromyces robustus]
MAHQFAKIKNNNNEYVLNNEYISNEKNDYAVDDDHENSVLKNTKRYNSLHILSDYKNDYTKINYQEIEEIVKEFIDVQPNNYENIDMTNHLEKSLNFSKNIMFNENISHPRRSGDNKFVGLNGEQSDSSELVTRINNDINSQKRK